MRYETVTLSGPGSGALDARDLPVEYRRRIFEPSPWRESGGIRIRRGRSAWERAVTWWARRHEFEGRSGGWIYRVGSDRALAHGWWAFSRSRYVGRSAFRVRLRGSDTWVDAWGVDLSRVEEVAVLSDAEVADRGARYERAMSY
jgi:hypothetical protein